MMVGGRGADEAVRQIGNLVYGLAEAIDDGDLVRVEALFGDATFQLADHEPRVGGAAFARTIDRSMLRYDGRPCTLHVVTNLRVQVDEGPTARSTSYVAVFQGRPDLPLQAVLTGRYADAFVLDHDATWRWTSRRMRIDHLGDTSHHTRTDLT